MTKVVGLITVLFFPLLSAVNAGALDRSGFDELTQIMDSGMVVEADVFTPKTWEKAVKSFQKAKASIERGRKQKAVDKDIAKAREYVENAIKAAEVCKLSLQEYLAPRDKAKKARAPVLVPELYTKAEKRFMIATRKVEAGDIKGALKEAEKAMPLFDTAELEAIRTDILGTADKLLEKGVADNAAQYALSTLNKARGARAKANDILTKDRYNRGKSVEEAKRAEYEARHASNIALSVRSLKRNDQAWEKLMLLYEIQMNRVGKALDFGFLPFDNGPLAAADTLVNSINSLKAENQQLTSQKEALSSGVSERLRQVLERLGATVTDNDPIILAQTVEKRIADFLVDKSKLAEQVETSRTELAELSQEHKETTAELSTRKEQEEKFKAAKSILNPSEGEVLFNSSNDIVLRLTGLSFDISKSEIKDEHVPLLEKVKQVIQLFPNAQLMVEGHTDASGEPSANVLLSEKRAFAVMQYLRQSLLIPADRIRSIGYGAERPVASNRTADGRSKNRRIDILVMQ